MSFRKCGWEVEHISAIFIVCQVKGYRNILKQSCRSLALSHEFFKKTTKGGLELVSLPYFLHDFWKKIFILLYSINIFIIQFWFHCLVAFALCDIGQYVHCICLLTRLNVIKFEINLIFLIKLFFLHEQKGKTKI